jgi:hypothetical protein
MEHPQRLPRKPGTTRHFTMLSLSLPLRWDVIDQLTVLSPVLALVIVLEPSVKTTRACLVHHKLIVRCTSLIPLQWFF